MEDSQKFLSNKRFEKNYRFKKISLISVTKFDLWPVFTAHSLMFLPTPRLNELIDVPTQA